MGKTNTIDTCFIVQKEGEGSGKKISVNLVRNCVLIQ